MSFLQRGWLSSNSVLLKDDRQSILIDTGYWTHADQTAQLVAQHLDGQPLDLILNTHLHSDHCGGNATLQSLYPQSETRIPPGRASFVFDWDPAALSYVPTGQHCPVFRADAVMQAGDEFEVAGMVWEAFAAPGHDPDSLIFFCHSHGILISADALWENGFGVVFPEIEGIHAFDEVAATLDLIERLSPKLILPGHGSAFTDCSAALKQARDKLKRFVQEPQKHALYAAKVLLKFKLLELQQVNHVAFADWATKCELLQLLHAQHDGAKSFALWFEFLIHELVRSQAATLDGECVHNA